MLVKWLSNVLVSRDHEQQLIENFFANSTDLADLERRQRMVERGQAPWQGRTKSNIGGWI